MQTIGEVATVIDTGRHTEPIGMTIPIKNNFYIKLRANKKLSLKEKEHANNKIVSLFKK